jgi:Glycosyl hydrolase family 12
VKQLAALAIVFGFIALPIGGAAAGQPAVILHPCLNPNYRTHSPSGSVAYGSNTVNAEVWNDESDRFTLKACSQKSWTSVSSSPPDGKAVQSYPDTQALFDDPTVASMPDLVSNFAYQTSACTKGDAFETAYDIYLGGSKSWKNKKLHTELMIWGTNCNQTFGETEVAKNVAIDGYAWDIYENGNFTNGNGVFLIYDSTSSIVSGQYDLSDFFGDAEGRGYLEAGAQTHLWAVDDGGEFCQGENVTIGLEAFSAKEG